jgi:hypothetical protein
MTHRALFTLVLALGLLVGSCSGGGGSGGAAPGGGPPPPGPKVGDVSRYPWLGVKRALFIIVAYQGTPPLFEASAAGEDEVKAIRADLIDAIDKNSYGQVSLQVDYTWPPLRIQKQTADYDPADGGIVQVRSDAIAVARAAGYDPDAYDREVLFAPNPNDEVWNGNARGWIRTAWMPHKLTWVLLHELGHTLSRGHANFWDGDPLQPRTKGAGMEREYGDVYDPMGTGRQWSRLLYSGPWFKLRSSWIDDQDVLTVTQSGTYTLSPLEKPDPMVGPTALRIRRDEDYDYWLVHRSMEPAVAQGPVFVLTSMNPYRQSLLLDMNRGTAGGEEVDDAALAVGQVFDDSAARGITIENVTPPGDNPITLQVTLDETRQTTLDRKPRVEVRAPPRDEGPVSGSVDFEVLAVDPDEGETNGIGIARLLFHVIGPTSSDEMLNIVWSTEVTEAPYEFTLDTTAGATPDDFYHLQIQAEADDGAVTTIWYRFIVDNYTPSQP